jgi:hypothetical protein
VRESDCLSPSSSDSPQIGGVGGRAVKRYAGRYLRWLLVGEGVTRRGGGQAGADGVPRPQ